MPIIDSGLAVVVDWVYSLELTLVYSVAGILKWLFFASSFGDFSGLKNFPIFLILISFSAKENRKRKRKLNYCHQLVQAPPLLQPGSSFTTTTLNQHHHHHAQQPSSPLLSSTLTTAQIQCQQSPSPPPRATSHTCSPLNYLQHLPLQNRHHRLAKPQSPPPCNPRTIHNHNHHNFTTKWTPPCVSK